MTETEKIIEKIEEENKRVELMQKVIGIIEDMYLKYGCGDRLVKSIDYSEEKCLPSGTQFINIWFKNIQFGMMPKDIKEEYEMDYIYRDETGYTSIDFNNRVKNMRIVFNFS